VRRCLLIQDPFFLFNFKSFFHYIVHSVGLPHPLAHGLSHYICDQPLDLMGMHLLHCAHGGEKTISYDVVYDAFMSIVKDA
jgi:hypothetical protein